MSYDMVALLVRTLYKVGMAGLGGVEIGEMVKIPGWQSSKCGGDSRNGVHRDCRVVALFQLFKSVKTCVSIAECLNTLNSNLAVAC